MAMTGWLSTRRAHIVGDAPDIAEALAAQGAQCVSEGACDILVHVVAAPQVKPVHELSHAEWRATLHHGLDQRFLEAKAFAEARRALGLGGAVLFVGAPEQALGSDHAAAAGALGNLVKTLGVEWARDGIRVNAILSQAAGTTRGNLAAYLVSDYSAYVTGAVMGIDCDDG
jgi:NAD(P)-dependent dehydrogenase (short-subunit alcohol dehydrogenase family)